MKLTSRDVIELLKTIKELGYRRFRLQHEELTLEVDTEPGTALTPEPDTIQTSEDIPGTGTIHPPAEAPSRMSTRATAVPLSARLEPPKEGALAVTAPMTGTFYRTPSPGAPPFVEVGSKVGANDIVCIIEVMKLFNSIPAGVAGTVLTICVENEAFVRAGQVVIWIEPDPYAEQRYE